MTASQVHDVVEAVEDLLGVGHERRRAPGRTACRARGARAPSPPSTPPVRCATSTNSPSCASRGSGTRRRQSSRASPCRPSARTTPERVEHVVGEPSCSASVAGHRGVLLDHAVDLAVARERELEPDPEPVQRRLPAPISRSIATARARAAQLVVVLVGLQRDVVAEPLRLLVRVGVAADVDEQRRVVDGGARSLVEPTARRAQRDQALRGARAPSAGAKALAPRAPSAARSRGRCRATAPRRARPAGPRARPRPRPPPRAAGSAARAWTP
jgi:hypothetical protein